MVGEHHIHVTAMVFAERTHREDLRLEAPLFAELDEQVHL